MRSASNGLQKVTGTFDFILIKCGDIRIFHMQLSFSNITAMLFIGKKSIFPYF